MRRLILHSYFYGGVLLSFWFLNFCAILPVGQIQIGSKVSTRQSRPLAGEQRLAIII